MNRPEAGAEQRDLGTSTLPQAPKSLLPFSRSEQTSFRAEVVLPNELRLQEARVYIQAGGVAGVALLGGFCPGSMQDRLRSGASAVALLNH